ncbi:hypothetical protein PQX77_015609 [Marasmius sp. AFHP31]|nr:hypothetical protein PQX77_015609 [Marasmius sp. AFHP31]
MAHPHTDNLTILSPTVSAWYDASTRHSHLQSSSTSVFRCVVDIFHRLSSQSTNVSLSYTPAHTNSLSPSSIANDFADQLAKLAHSLSNTTHYPPLAPIPTFLKDTYVLYDPSPPPEHPYKSFHAYSAVIQLYARSSQLDASFTKLQRLGDDPRCSFGCRELETPTSSLSNAPQFDEYRRAPANASRTLYPNLVTLRTSRIPLVYIRTRSRAPHNDNKHHL